MVFLSNMNLVIATVYRPPRCPEDSFQQCLLQINNFISTYNNPDVMITGDFNLPFIEWTSGRINQDQRLSSEVKSAENLMDFTDDNFLIQMVEETTRDEKSILDLIFTNNPESIHQIEVEKTKMSDHDIIYAGLNYAGFQKAKHNKECNIPNDSPFDDLNFAKSDWEAIRTEISHTDWSSYYKETDPSKLGEVFDTLVANACKRHTPCHSSSTKDRVKIPPKRRSLLRRKKRLNSRINCLKYVCANPNKETIKELNKQKADIELEIRDSIKEEKEKDEKQAIERIKKNVKAFYSYAKRTSKTKDPIGPLKDSNGNLQNDPLTMANILQDQYSKVFSDPNALKRDINDNPSETPTIEDIDFNEEDILNAINDMSRYSATGPDKFSAEILKECKQQLCSPIQHLWRMSLNQSDIPTKYLQQTIVPIYKKGDRSLAANYRPVSLTSHIIKIFERVLRQKLVEHIEQNNLLSNQQHGFRHRRNCLTQLIHHFDDILQALENDSNADIVYLDFSKAFDKVDHKLLLLKLFRMGIKGKLLSWLTSFLSNRSQQVLVNGTKSRPIPVISGVPQGTVLGPLLFIVYINDITEVVEHCHIKIFADDSKLQNNIQSPEDRHKLQADLDAVINWSKDNNMELNQDKFELLHYGYNEELKDNYILPSGVSILSSDTVKDLGIMMNNKLSWNDHYYKMIKEAKKYAGWILRTFSSRSKSVILLLYGSFVRSRLEYSCPLWSPHTKKDIIMIEAVQRSITAKINGMSDLNYWERLKALKLYSLQRRRERYSIIHVWKISQFLAPNDISMIFHFNDRYGPTAVIPKLTSKRQRTNTLRDKSFSSMGPRLYNLLPKDIKLLDTLPSFKYQLDQFIQKYPDTPPTPGYVAANGNSLVDWVACGTQTPYTCKSSFKQGGATKLDMA